MEARSSSICSETTATFSDAIVVWYETYSGLPRAWPEIPLYLEIDGLLDYLFHHGDKPSHPYKALAARELTESLRDAEIVKYATEFRHWARLEREDSAVWRADNSRQIRRLLSPGRIGSLTRTDIERVARKLGSAQESDRRLNSCGNPESDQFGFGSHHSLGFEE